MSDIRPFPWVFPYAEDPTSGRTHPTGRIVYRPVVNITLGGPDEADDAMFLALVDSGAERVLAPAPGAIGVEWRAEVGFFSAWTSAPWQVVLGQVGFFGQFTVCFSRQALRLAIEPAATFHERFGIS